MNGIDLIADTNALIYMVAGNLCMLPYISKKLGVSVISEIELLSFHGLTDDDELVIKRMLSQCNVIDLSNDVRQAAISLRRKYTMRLPDAIIAATSAVCDVPLVTADKGFRKITEIDVKLIVPILQSST